MSPWKTRRASRHVCDFFHASDSLPSVRRPADQSPALANTLKRDVSMFAGCSWCGTTTRKYVSSIFVR